MKKNLGLIFKYLTKHKVQLIFAIFFAIVYVVICSAIPLLTGKLIDEITLTVNDLSLKIENTNFYLFVAITSSLIVLGFVFGLLCDNLILSLNERITKELKDNLFIKINNLPISYIDSIEKGELVSRIINDVEQVNVGLTASIKQLLQGVFQIICTLVFMFVTNWILGLAILLITPFGFLISYLVSKNSNKHFKEVAKINGQLASYVLEEFDNIELIQSNNYEDNLIEKYSKKNAELYLNGQKAQFISSFTNPSTRLINNMAVLLVLLLSSLLCVFTYSNENVFLGTSCTIGTIVIFIQYANNFAKPLNEISSCLPELQNANSSLFRINSILSLEDEKDTGNIIITEDFYNLSTENLYFAYNKDQHLIENLNIAIKKGQKIAIVGPTGCGKTTIINLLLRFYEPVSGDIFFNEKNIKDISKENTRNYFTMVLQDTWIFKGTVAENIAFGKKEYTKEDIIEVSKKAYCYDFISKLENGFETIIDDNSQLSQGEKQLICIARAMLASKEFVILDEATSNIDSRTELLVKRAFDRMLEGKTSVCIAHRLSTIKNSDLILVMNNGNVIEAGNHKELMMKQGFYYDLYMTQYKK